MRFIALSVTVLLLQACGGDKTTTPREYVQHNTPSGSSVSQAYKADTSCSFGDGSCNVCANNVQKQFHDAVSGKLKWTDHAWRFSWTKAYEPDNATPKSIFGSPVKGVLGVNASVKHVQGFVRTNSNTYPYAGSHSHTKLGGIFVVKQSTSGLDLVSLHHSGNAHPSGVQILGKYLVYGDGGKLVFKDLNSNNQVNDIQLSIQSAAFGGGLGAVRLKSGEYLLISTGPGGEKNVNEKRNQFYNLTFQNGAPSNLNYLNKSAVSIPSGWDSKYRLSENLSVISECGTGDIYTVNVSGSTGIGLFSGSGYWKLSKLESNNSGLTLTAINYYKIGQNINSCTSRASGTVSVNSNKQLEFYCHEHGKDINKTASSYRFEKGSF